MLRRLLLCTVLAGLTLVPYAQTLRFDFVTWDDPEYVTANEHVRRGLTRDGIVRAFTTGDVANWQPLVTLSHMLDVQLFGFHAGGHHATNVALHVANTLVLFGLLVSTTAAVVPSAWTAALFALHPLHVEPVVWVSARKDVLSTLFGLLALWAYARWARRGGRGRYLLTLGLAALGLMAKPMLVTLPALFLLLDYWPLARRPTLRLLVEKVPFAVLSVAAAVVTLAVQARAGGVDVPAPIPLGLRAANAAVSYVRYLGKLLWPANLSVLYPHPNLAGGTPWAPWQVAGAVALLLAVTVGVARSGRRYLVFGWLWYVVALLPVSGLVPSGFEAMADRWTYVPLIGLFVAIAWAADEMAARSPSWRLAVGVTAAATVVAATGCSWYQTRWWRDSIVLYEHSLRAAPDPPYLRYNLANALARQGRTEEAIVQYRRAVEILPSYSVNNLGAALLAVGRIDEAIAECREATRLDPTNAQAYNNLGRALEVKGRLDEAIDAFRNAVTVRPGYALGHFNLGRVLHGRGQLDDAIVHYREALRLDPDFGPARAGLQMALRARS